MYISLKNAKNRENIKHTSRHALAEILREAYVCFLNFQYFCYPSVKISCWEINVLWRFFLNVRVVKQAHGYFAEIAEIAEIETEALRIRD